MKITDLEEIETIGEEERIIEVLSNQPRFWLVSNNGPLVPRLIALKDVVVLAVPISGVALTTMLGSTFNGLVLANLGENYLAAGALTTATQTCVMMLFNSILFSLSPLTSRAVAEGRLRDVGCLVQNGCLLGVILSIPAIGIFLSMKPILSLFQQPSNLVNLSNSYFTKYVVGVPGGIFLTCLQQFILGIKQSKFAVLNGILGLGVIIPTGYCLAFGKLDLPALNIAGLGYAQAGRNWFCFLSLTSLFFLLKRFKQYDIFSINHQDRFQKLKQIISLGWPISIQAVSEYFYIFALTILAGKLGENSLLGQQVAAQYMMMLLVPFLALSQTSSILVSQSVGAKSWQVLKRYGETSLGLGLLISSLFFMSFSIAPDLFISPYIDVNNANNFPLISQIKPYLYIMFGTQVFESLRTISTGTLRGVGDSKTPMIVNAIASWIIGLPLAYLLSSQLNLGITGIAIAQVVSLSISGVLLVDRWRAESRNVALDDTEEKIDSLTSKLKRKVQSLAHFSFFKQKNEITATSQEATTDPNSEEIPTSNNSQKDSGWFSFFSSKIDASKQRKNNFRQDDESLTVSKNLGENEPLILEEEPKKSYM